MGVSPALWLYRMASPLVAAYARRVLAKRVANGKEPLERLDERKGIASESRPEGTLVWLHAASVNESWSLLDLIEGLLEQHPELNFLITTGTRSSADLPDIRLPEHTRHQFVPIDTIPIVDRFLDHWQPDLAIWTESELWPALITRTSHRGIPMLLLNGRMSHRSARKWHWFRGMASNMLNRFDAIHAQDTQSARHFKALGASVDRVQVAGSLKKSGGALPHDEDERNQISQMLEARSVWLAASTHPGEEEMAAQAHRKAQKASHRLLLIIAPRDPERGPEIAQALRDDGFRVGLRSAGDEPEAAYNIYVADTPNEMGLWYRIAPVSFVGGSLVEVGGHNPYEAAALGSAILHGPYIESAGEIYERLDETGGAREVKDAQDLGRAVVDLLAPHKAAELAHAAWEISSSGAEASTAASDAILNMLDLESAD